MNNKMMRTTPNEGSIADKRVVTQLSPKLNLSPTKVAKIPLKKLSTKNK